MPSKALTEFGSAISLAAALHDLESKYPDPPPVGSPASIDEMRGLRGGAIVLMVGAFERFAREAVSEHLIPLATAPSKVAFNKLPQKLQIASVFKSLERAMNGPRHGAPKGRVARLVDIRHAAARVVDGLVDAEVLGKTGGNADATTIKALLIDLGIKDPFAGLRAVFDAAWGKPEAVDFVQDKLNAIVAARHQVAHSVSVLTIGRADVGDGVRFLKALAPAIDDLLERHLKSL